jgi:hypothetical protein
VISIIKSFKEGKTCSSIVSNGIYGIPFKAITYPIKDSHSNVVGAIGIGKSLAKQFNRNSK